LRSVIDMLPFGDDGPLTGDALALRSSWICDEGSDVCDDICSNPGSSKMVAAVTRGDELKLDMFGDFAGDR